MEHSNRIEDIKLQLIKIQKIDRIKDKFANELPLKREVCMEIKDENDRYNAIEKVINEYWQYIIDWADLNDFFFYDKDSNRHFNIHHEIIPQESLPQMEIEKYKTLCDSYLNMKKELHSIGKEHVRLERKFQYQKELLPVKEKDNTEQKQDKKYFSQIQRKKTTPKLPSQFSVLEWATIFYYVEQIKMANGKDITDMINRFISDNKINTTLKCFRTKYYQTKKRINETKDYPVDKLDKIISFADKNYPKVVTLIIEDKKFLLSEQSGQ